MRRSMKLKALTFALFFATLASLAASAATHGTYLSRPSSAHHDTVHSPSVSRPFYDGGHHTTSHGGSYPGETNANHKNGHYRNWRSTNRYGVHKPR
jgi:hypothetical protein